MGDVDGSPTGTQRRTGLAAFAGVNAAAAWGGAIGLVVGALSFGDDLDARLPFDSLVLAGIALGLVVALPLSALAVMAWIDDPRTDVLATIVGAVLVAWIALQVVVLHAFSWFHPLYLTIGATFVALGGHVGRRGRGALLTVAGVTCVAVGIGLLPHLIDDSFSPTAVVSIVITVGGVVLVVLGTLRLFGGMRPWNKLAGGVGLAIVLAISVWLIAPPVAATHVPPSSISSTPADRGLDADSITLTTADEVELAGWYVHGSNGAAVILLHGAGSTRSEVLDQAEVLARNDYGVLMIDARGHGASGGTAMDFGWYGDLDIAAGTEYLRARADVEPGRIGVVGMSMGGEEAIGAAASDPNIAAVVAEGATGRTSADKSWLSDEYGWRGAVQEQFEKAQFWVVDYLTESPPPVSLRAAVAASGDTPFLLITAGDVPDEQSAAEFIASAAPDRVDVWNVAGSAHTGGLRTEPAEWEQRVVAFLDAQLAESGE
jgi:pimeloyl-ACP methyl ester carboxylesterase